MLVSCAFGDSVTLEFMFMVDTTYLVGVDEKVRDYFENQSNQSWQTRARYDAPVTS